MANISHRYIIRKQRIAPGYLTRVEIIAEVEAIPISPNDTVATILNDLNMRSFFTLAPGEQLIIHNAGDN
jgi:hypothetical protein